MEEKGFIAESVADGGPKNIPVQITTIKLTKGNYLTRAAAEKKAIVGRGCINYINRKMKQLDEDSSSWN